MSAILDENNFPLLTDFWESAKIHRHAKSVLNNNSSGGGGD